MKSNWKKLYLLWHEEKHGLLRNGQQSSRPGWLEYFIYVVRSRAFASSICSFSSWTVICVCMCVFVRQWWWWWWREVHFINEDAPYRSKIIKKNLWWFWKKKKENKKIKQRRRCIFDCRLKAAEDRRSRVP